MDRCKVSNLERHESSESTIAARVLEVRLYTGARKLSTALRLLSPD